MLRFRAEATVDTYRSAGYPAVDPRTPSVMRVVQSAMMPRSRPAHLVVLCHVLVTAVAALHPGNTMSHYLGFRAYRAHHDQTQPD